MKPINDVFEEDQELVTEVFLEDVSAETSLKGDTDADIMGDYNFVREKLIKSIVRGSELIDESVKAAKTDPSARSIEAASGAVKTLTDASKGLLELHEKIRSISKEKPLEETPGTLSDKKVVLKSTLSDLIKQIDDQDKEEKIAKCGPT